ncbi:MAG: hypothetical protein WD002_12155 [Pseudomonadales bacterium]
MTSSTHDAVEREWQRLGSTGTWWTGKERVAIAAEYRAARLQQKSTQTILSEAAVEAVHKIASKPHTVDQEWIQSCHDRDLAPFPMVELMAIVALLSAVDTYAEGIGVELRTLPEPEQVSPTETPAREVPDNARINAGWLPTVGRASAAVCMSAVPDEQAAWEDLHTHLYLSIDEMRDLDFTKDLHRSQIELLASRTSLYNDCFY